MSPGLAVLGTDTGCGKTVVTAALALRLRGAGWRVSVMKPFATGGRLRGGRLVSPDAIWLKRVLRLDEPDGLVNPVCFSRPLAPWVAARLEGRSPGFLAAERAFSALRSRGTGGIILVEGVGGVLVPLSARMTIADFCVRLGLPAVLVARAGLGTINHTWLSVEALRARRVGIAGVLLNGAKGVDQSEEHNAGAIARLAGVDVLATLPWVMGVRYSGSRLARLAARIPLAAVRRLCRAAGAGS